MQRPVLLRIPFSHFCRKAEWGLTQAGIPYDALDVALWQMKHARRANPRQGTVPVLLTQEAVLMDSRDILLWADQHRAAGALPLYPASVRPAVEDWEAWAGDVVGPAVRREAYRVLHATPSVSKGYAPFYFRIPLVSKRLFLNVLKHYKARRFDAEDPLTVELALAKVAEQLRVSQTGYLLAKHATAADHAVAALFEPLILAAERRGYHSNPHWLSVRAFVDRVRPGATTIVKRRGVREKDWQLFETAARSVGAAPQNQV